MKINIIYWSGTGNTAEMAKLIAEGAGEAGAEVSIKTVSQAAAGDIESTGITLLGCPSMGDEVLEESEFEPFMEAAEDKLAGKRIGIFGSYGWGDGQWMRDWEERIKNTGADLIAPGIIVNEFPAGDEAEKCREYGKSLLA